MRVRSRVRMELEKKLGVRVFQPVLLQHWNKLMKIYFCVQVFYRRPSFTRWNRKSAKFNRPQCTGRYSSVSISALFLSNSCLTTKYTNID